MTTTTDIRPSMALYLRESPDWREIAAEGEYAFAYEMGARDAKAGLPMLAPIPVGYGEGYSEGYADFS